MATKLENHCHLGFHAATLFHQASLPQVKVEAEEIPVSDFRKGHGGDKQMEALWMSPPRASPEGLSPHGAVQWLEEIKNSAAFVEDGQECILKSAQLPQLSPGTDAEIYLATFEQVASICGWPKSEWVMRLVPLLTGDAQQAYNSLEPIDAEDYAKVKTAILREDMVSTETWRQRFRQFGCHEASGPREACSLLWELGRCWLKPESHTKEQILELLVLEQFLMVLPEEMQRWVLEHQPKTCAQAVDLAEEFQEDTRLKAKASEDQAAVCVKIEEVTSETMDADPVRESLPSQFCPDRGAQQEEGRIEYKLCLVSGKEPQEMGVKTRRTTSCEKQRAVNWGEKETRAFLSIWGHEHIQKILQHQSQDEEVYKKIALQMIALGYDRDWEQCRQRAKELCRGYKDVRDQNWHTGRGRQMWQYFEDLDAILGPLLELGHRYERNDGAGDLGGDICLGGSMEADSQSSAELADMEQNGIWAMELKERKDNSQALFQRAANWGEKETRDFLRIWGQKRVQRLLHQQHWNEGIYKEVSVEMAALGYSRDWEQCRQRAKDLRRGYKDIKDRKRRSARGRKVWQYFEELDVILGQGADPVEGADSLQNWKDDFMDEGLSTQNASPVGAQDSDQMDGMSGSSEEAEDLPAPCQRAEKWGEKETLDFLGIWGQDHIQSLLHHHHRNEEVYKKIAADMAILGYERDWEQCRQRAKDLRRGYREVKDQNLCSRRGRQMWQYFEELDGILRRWYEVGSEHAEEQVGLDGASGGTCTQKHHLGHHVSSQTCHTHPAERSNSPDTSALQVKETTDSNGHAEQVGGQTPAQRAAKWGERETRDFLSIWGHDSVQGQLHQQYRNEEVYKQIATQMAALGYDRDWEQCRQRAKDLRRSYRDAKDQNRRYGRGRQVWQYFEELDAILGRWSDKGSGPSERDKGEDGPALELHTGGSVSLCVSTSNIAGPVLLETQLQGPAKRGRVQVAEETAMLDSCSC
ncbi:zinc finger and SCAN domain-containing protein 20 [Pogona vitticeps]